MDNRPIQDQVSQSLFRQVLGERALERHGEERLSLGKCRNLGKRRGPVALALRAKERCISDHHAA